MMTRKEAIDVIRRKDHALDQRCIRDFCEFCGYRESEFYEILDKLYNKEIFRKNDLGEWVLKHPIWEED